MAGAKEIRTKIKSIKSTQKITRAMEMVAASKMRKAQDRMLATRPYSQYIEEVALHLAEAQVEVLHPYLVRRPLKRVGLIVVSTDRGLCGGLNANLFRRCLQQLMAWKEAEVGVEVCCIGTKGQAFFRRLGADIVAQSPKLGDTPSVQEIIGPIAVMLQAYREGQIDALLLAHNDFVNTMSQKPEIKQLLPILPPSEEKKSKAMGWDYLYEPDPSELIDTVLNRYLETLVYQGVVENFACEQAARMVAMKSASDNAGELIGDLQLVYNKARQAAITQELSEIVSGASAV